MNAVQFCCVLTVLCLSFTGQAGHILVMAGSDRTRNQGIAVSVPTSAPYRLDTICCNQCSLSQGARTSRRAKYRGELKGNPASGPEDEWSSQPRCHSPVGTPGWRRRGGGGRTARAALTLLTVSVLFVMASCKLQNPHLDRSNKVTWWPWWLPGHSRTFPLTSSAANTSQPDTDSLRHRDMLYRKLSVEGSLEIGGRNDGNSPKLDYEGRY